MDSDDFSLIDIAHQDDAGLISSSPLVAAGSSSYSRPPQTVSAAVLKDEGRYGEVGGTLPDHNKENLNETCNMKLGSSNLSLEPQKMKRNRKAGGYNLRKSFAWDKAFFTEEGVLSNFELSMICGTPSKLDGFPAISQEQRTPMHYSTTPTDLHTVESKSFRKLNYSSNKDKRTGEGSILKQKPPASGSLKSKKLAPTTSAKNSERKEGSSSRILAPTSTNKRLLSTSPAKPLSHISKMSRVPTFKPDPHLSSTTASSSGASHVKRNRITPPVPSAQKQLGQKGGSNPRSTSNGPNIVSQRIPKPSKCSDQRTRKNRTAPCSREQSSTRHQVSNTKLITSSELITGKVLPVGLEANDGTCKAAVSVQGNTGNTSSIQQPIQPQTAKPSGLKMPSPSLRFFGESKTPKATMGRIPSPGPAQPSSVSTISHNVGATSGVMQSRTPAADVDRVSDPSPVQPCSVPSIHIPKIHDELEHVKKDGLIVTMPDLLDGKPLKHLNNKCLEEVEKHLVELEHTCLSTPSVDGEDKRSASPIRECRYNNANLLQRSEDKLITPWIDNKSGFQARQEHNDLPVMSESLGLGALHTPNGNNCCPDMPYRINEYKEVQELHCPSPVTDEISQVNDGMSSNIEDLLNRSFSPEIISQSDNIDSVVPEIDVYKTLVVRETLSASLENILDTINKQQELEVLQCPLPPTEKHVRSADGIMIEDNSLGIVTDEDKVTELFPLEVALSASLDTKQQEEEHVDLSVAECTNQIDLTDQNADLELQMPPRACKSTSQVDAGICNVELSLSQAQRLGSPDAELPTLESDQQHVISDELLGEPLMPDKATSALLYSSEAVCEDVSVICNDTQLIGNSNMEMLVNANKNRSQTSNSPATTYNSEACSPRSSVDLSFPLTVSKECSNDKDKVEADYQMNKEPLSPSLNNQQVENHVLLIYDNASGNDSMSVQPITQEPQSSSPISGDCTTTSAANCHTMVSSSPCKYESTFMRKESMDETDEQVEPENHLEDIMNEDEKTSSRIVKDGKVQSQLVIKPPGDVALFSDEWLAAVEAAGEDILTLKAGPVQNSPPSKLSPEPSPWSPVKKKNNQGIGPYDCTKYSSGQH